MSRPSRTGTHSSARPRLTKLSYRVKCQASSGSGWCFKRSLSCDDFWQPKVRTTDWDIPRPLGRKCPNLLLREWWIQLIELLRQNSCSKADIIIITIIIIIIYILYICHYIIESWNVFFFSLGHCVHQQRCCYRLWPDTAHCGWQCNHENQRCGAGHSVLPGTLGSLL